MRDAQAKAHVVIVGHAGAALLSALGELEAVPALVHDGSLTISGDRADVHGLAWRWARFTVKPHERFRHTSGHGLVSLETLAGGQA